MNPFSRVGYIVDIFNKNIFYGQIDIEGDRIISVMHLNSTPPANAKYILPGFIDSHVHIESSMLVPSEFARLAVVHGTIGTISDPHEIANVCGMEGVQYMIDNGKTVPFKFNFGAPSCVPATTHETAGAELDSVAVDKLLQNPEIKYLSEMMNFPGVLNKDPEVMRKIASATKHGKPVDGHAPGLRGISARNYVEAGISTDHECFTMDEADEKLSYGMKILIREGSAAKNFEALIPLLNNHAENIMFCSDDKHPDSLEQGHINLLCERAVTHGIDIFKILQAACINPVLHYKLDVGLLRKGDKADFIIIENLKKFKVLETFIEGKMVARDGISFINPAPAPSINQFNCSPVSAEDFKIPAGDKHTISVIEAIDGQLITNHLTLPATIRNSYLESNTESDVLKIAVINRYQKTKAAKGFIKNFGIKHGAIASSVAHDSHNIVIIGTDDEAMARAANLVIQATGGVSAVYKSEELLLELPIAGLMSNLNGYDVASSYTRIDKFVKEVMGSSLSAPFMTLSFMALLVIPHLKLSDKGLFDGDSFAIID